MKVERRNAECPVLNVSQEGGKQLEDVEIVLRYKAIGPTVVQNMLHCYRMEEMSGGILSGLIIHKIIYSSATNPNHTFIHSSANNPNHTFIYFFIY